MISSHAARDCLTYSALAAGSLIMDCANPATSAWNALMASSSSLPVAATGLVSALMVDRAEGVVISLTAEPLAMTRISQDFACDLACGITRHDQRCLSAFIGDALYYSATLAEPIRLMSQGHIGHRAGQ